MTAPRRNDTPPATPRRSRVVLVVGAMLLASALVKSWLIVASNPGVDFYHFWVVPRAVRTGETVDVYGPEARRTLGALYLDRAQAPGQESWRRQKAAQFFVVLEPSGTPFFYTVMAPWSFGGYDAGVLVFQLLSTVAGLTALMWFVGACGVSWEGVVLAAVLFTDWFEPWASDVRTSNVNRLLLGLLALFLWIRRRPATARRDVVGGLVLGATVCFKPILVYCPVALWCLRLVRKEYRVLGREAVGCALATAGAVAVSSLYFGSWHAWVDWMSNLNGILTPDAISVAKGNYSPVAVLGETSHFDPTAYLVVFLAGLGVPLAFGLAQKARGARGEATGWRDEALFVALGIVVYLGTARLMWLHYHLLSVIPLALLATSEGRGRAWVGAVVGAFFCIAVDPLIALFRLKDPIVFAQIVCAGAFLMTALLVAEIVRPERR